LLALGAWILSNIDDAQSGPLSDSDGVDWDVIGPQDLAFGKLMITTRDGQVLFHDNPFVTLVIRMVGGAATVQTVQLTQSQVNQFLQESRIVFGNFFVQQTDKFIQQQQANLTNPTATGSDGSSTGPGVLALNTTPLVLPGSPSGPSGGPQGGPNGGP